MSGSAYGRVVLSMGKKPKRKAFGFFFILEGKK